MKSVEYQMDLIDEISASIGNSINGLFLGDNEGKSELVQIIRNFANVIEKTNSTVDDLHDIKAQLKAWNLAKLAMMPKK